MIEFNDVRMSKKFHVGDFPSYFGDAILRLDSLPVDHLNGDVVIRQRMPALLHLSTKWKYLRVFRHFDSPPRKGTECRIRYNQSLNGECENQEATPHPHLHPQEVENVGLTVQCTVYSVQCTVYSKVLCPSPPKRTFPKVPLPIVSPIM